MTDADRVSTALVSVAPSVYWLSETEAVINSMDVSECTRLQYQREVRRLLEWLAGRQLYPNVLLDWKKHLRARVDIGTGTKAKYLSVARALFRELYRLQLIPLDVTVGVKGFKVHKIHKRAPLTDAEIATAISFVNDLGECVRDRALVALLLYQGLRRVELTRLRVEDFNKEEKILLVLGKGQDDRIAANLHPRSLEVLDAYLKWAELKSGALFPSPRSPYASLSGSALWRIIMRIHQRLGLHDRNAHAWRKAFTTRLIQSGMNLLEVQGYTRHASLQMLQVYYNRLESSKTLPAYYAAFES